MPRKSSYLTVTDQFCGAGGSSQGVRRFAQRSGLGNGLQVKLALNHWTLAIETHAHNFPETIHDCTDIQACDPRYYPSTDILVTSPECTNHSVAKGRKQVKAQLDAFDRGEQDPAAERSRATMWDVVRFAEHHQYRIVITENVVDARAWVLWDAWIMAMHNLGYHHQCVFFNSMFAWPTPQSRDRMYVVFWKKGQRKPDLDIRPVAPCLKCGTVHAVQKFKPGANVKAKYGRQYVYVCPSCAKEVMPFYFAAINAIDWSLPAVRIKDRKRPLSEKTMARVAHGLQKYGSRPLIMTNQHSSGLDCRVKDATAQPAFTQSAVKGMAVASPFVITLRGTSTNHLRSSASGLYDPIGTVSAGGVHHALVTSEVSGFLARYYGGSHVTMGLHEAVSTVSGKIGHALVTGTTDARIEDLYYRMLVNPELKRVMAFDESYVILGKDEEVTMQLGNAVTPPAMEILIERCVESLM